MTSATRRWQLCWIVLLGAAACGSPPAAEPRAPAAPAPVAPPPSTATASDPPPPDSAPSPPPTSDPTAATADSTPPPAPPSPGSQEIANAPGAAELEPGAGAALKGEWAKARKLLTAAIPKIEPTASVDALMAGHALVGRACARLGDTKCAEAQFTAALELWKDPDAAMKKIAAQASDEADRNKRFARAILAAGEALYSFAERKRADADALAMPAYTGAGGKDSVLKHVTAHVGPWIQKKRTLIEDAERAYVKVVALQPVPPPRWVIDSAARVGAMWGKFAADFRATPVPKEWSKKGPVPGVPGLNYEDMQSEYTSAITSASEPIVEKARGAFQRCHDFSVKFAYTDDLSRSCDDWLAKNPK